MLNFCYIVHVHCIPVRVAFVKEKRTSASSRLTKFEKVRLPSRYFVVVVVIVIVGIKMMFSEQVFKVCLLALYVAPTLSLTFEPKT